MYGETRATLTFTNLQSSLRCIEEVRKHALIVEQAVGNYVQNVYISKLPPAGIMIGFEG